MVSGSSVNNNEKAIDEWSQVHSLKHRSEFFSVEVLFWDIIKM